MSREDCQKLGTHNDAAKVAKGKSKRYLQGSLAAFQERAVRVLRQVRHTMNARYLPRGRAPLPATAVNVTDLWAATLLLLGGEGTGTALHSDWTEAFNLLLAVVADPTEVLPAEYVAAKWWFFHPSMVEKLDEEVKALGLEDVDGLASKPLLTEAQLDDLRKKVDAHAADQGITVQVTHYVLEQKPGFVVHVPPGWVHAVVNVKPCLKLAFDAYIMTNVHSYIEAHRKVVCKVFKKVMADDYMAIDTVLAGLCN